MYQPSKHHQACPSTNGSVDRAALAPGVDLDLSTMSTGQQVDQACGIGLQSAFPVGQIGTDPRSDRRVAAIAMNSDEAVVVATDNYEVLPYLIPADNNADTFSARWECRPCRRLRDNIEVIIRWGEERRLRSGQGGEVLAGRSDHEVFCSMLNKPVRAIVEPGQCVTALQNSEDYFLLGANHTTALTIDATGRLRACQWTALTNLPVAPSELMRANYTTLTTMLFFETAGDQHALTPEAN